MCCSVLQKPSGCGQNEKGISEKFWTQKDLTTRRGKGVPSKRNSGNTSEEGLFNSSEPPTTENNIQRHWIYSSSGVYCYEKRNYTSSGMSYPPRHFSTKAGWRKAKLLPEIKLSYDENINAVIEVSPHENFPEASNVCCSARYSYGQIFLYIFRFRETPNQFPLKRRKYHLQTPIVFKGIEHVETFTIRRRALLSLNLFSVLISLTPSVPVGDICSKIRWVVLVRDVTQPGATTHGVNRGRGCPQVSFQLLTDHLRLPPGSPLAVSLSPSPRLTVLLTETG